MTLDPQNGSSARGSPDNNNISHNNNNNNINNNNNNNDNNDNNNIIIKNNNDNNDNNNKKIIMIRIHSDNAGFRGIVRAVLATLGFTPDQKPARPSLAQTLDTMSSGRPNKSLC